MVERNDPARTGVKVGRVVGILTAGLAVARLLSVQAEYFRGFSLFLELLGVEPGLSVTVLFWGNALVIAGARYGLSYVLGSLIGVVYDWINRESVFVVLALALVVGVADGVYSGLEARSVLFGVGYLLAWLCYVPLFQWLYDPDAGDDRATPVRLS